VNSPAAYTNLQKQLLDAMKYRFEVSVLQNEAYLLSSFLDPRCKDSVFKSILTFNIVFYVGLFTSFMFFHNQFLF
jgi:hypothetical protein